MEKLKELFGNIFSQLLPPDEVSVSFNKNNGKRGSCPQGIYEHIPYASGTAENKGLMPLIRT